MESNRLLLRRIERTAIGLCLAMAVAALIAARGAPGPALGVLGGGLLVGTSYVMLKAGVSSLPEAIAQAPARARARRGSGSASRWRAGTLYSV